MSSRPCLAITRKLPQAVERRAALSYDVRANELDLFLDHAAMIAHAQGADALLACAADRLPAITIEALPDSVRMIATFSVGVDHIDLDAARRRGIVVANTPDVLTEATAEIALLLMVGAARRASEGERVMRAGPGSPEAWSGWAPTQMLGRSLSGKRLAILGMGRIGRAVAQRARAFGMTISYHNRTRLFPPLEQDADWRASAEELLVEADFLSLHCPATPETHHWLDARRIEFLPPAAIVVNTARGVVVDDAALIAALRCGRIAAVGLDVYEGEPRIHPGYRTLNNCFLLPHLGSATIETRNAMGFRALDNLDAFFQGRTPMDRVS
ncbi:Glycerate dehydrogenase [Azospirillaceae bacterium]